MQVVIKANEDWDEYIDSVSDTKLFYFSLLVQDLIAPNKQFLMLPLNNRSATHTDSTAALVHLYSQ